MDMNPPTCSMDGRKVSADGLPENRNRMVAPVGRHNDGIEAPKHGCHRVPEYITTPFMKKGVGSE